MKKIFSLVCALVLLLSICPMPIQAQAAANDTMQMSSVFLRTAEGKEGIFYGAYFNLSQETLDNMDRYGLALTPKTLEDDDAWTAAMDKSVQRSWYTTGLTAGVKSEVQSTSLVNIINTSNDSMTNNRNANTLIYVRPYVQMKDGSFVYGEVASCSMKQVAQWVDTVYNSLNDTQKRGLLGMYERFNSCMKGWGLSTVKGNYPYGTDVNGENLILQYRRNKVVSNMTAQNNVLWSFTTADGQPIRYSRSSNSAGLDADGDQTYTLYPGRVYRGIPYTHGSAGLDAFQTLAGNADASGVYNFENFNGSYFSGGSKNDSLNVARLGNDCWDAVYWAYATVGDSATADRTQQMTASYGLKLLGEDILTEAMQGFVAPDGREMGTGENAVWEFICNKGTSGYNKDRYSYRSIGDAVTGYTIPVTGYYTKSTALGLSSGTYTIDEAINGKVDGTRLVSYAIRQPTGELKSVASLKTDKSDLRGVYDYPALYETYALTQPGDAMVHFSNTEGHAIMVIETNIIYKADGTIDGDQSTVTLLEQASGHESRQSRSSWGSYTQSKHNSSHSTVKDDCKYCAGYTGQTTADGREIWALDYGLQVRSFKTMAASDYIPVTCEELINPAAKIATNKLADSNSTNSISNIYTGTLDSTYRVAYVTLNVYNANGQKVNSTTCFGTQADVTSPFAISRFVTDYTTGAQGSVLKGTPALLQQSHTYVVTDEGGNTVYTYKSAADGNYYKDAEGNYIEITGENPAPEGTTTFYNKVEKTATATWLEAPTLAEGSYGYEMVVTLASGYTKTFRSGYFTVRQGKNTVGQMVNLVYAD